MKPRGFYTNILWSFKRESNMTIDEYIVADLIYRMSTNLKAPLKGHCTMSRKEMSEGLYCSIRTLSRIVAKLRDSDFIVSSQDGKKLYTTKKYNEMRYRHYRAKDLFYLDSSPPKLLKVVAKSVDSPRHSGDNIYTYNKLKHSRLKQIEFFRSIEADFPKGKNLINYSAARRKFLINIELDKYGSKIKEDMSLLAMRYKSFLISWYEFAKRNPPKRLDKKDPELDLSDPSGY